MGYSKDDLMKLAEAGNLFTVDAEGMTKDDMIDLAGLCFKADGIVTFKNIKGLSIDDLLEITKAGNDAVALDLS